ncbi:hypothetical protein BRD01_06660 [Halobacteriales archaeon QS_8_65_32]|nr:MAG: hypothetical protein BRD01_06660 [Halobacteriales archaeon QS_8_65_32]
MNRSTGDYSDRADRTEVLTGRPRRLPDRIARIGWMTESTGSIGSAESAEPAGRSPSNASVH